MKKIVLLAVLIAMLGMGMIINAAPVSRQEAQKIATAWYKHLRQASVLDYTIEEVVGHDLAKTVIIALVEGYSTTRTINKVQK